MDHVHDGVLLKTLSYLTTNENTLPVSLLCKIYVNPYCMNQIEELRE